MENGITVQRLAQTLAIVSFVLVCWVVHRTFQKRTHCVNSQYISFVQIGSERVENCKFENRLSLKPLLQPLTFEQLKLVRALETIEPLNTLVKARQPRLAVDISLENPRAFEMGHGYVRIGREWLETDPLQTQRGLIMGVLKREQPQAYSTQFQLEVMTDFILLTVFENREWYQHKLTQDVRFATTAPSFADYCRSPFKSLAHDKSCKLAVPESADLQADVWGFRPLLAVALWRAYEHASLTTKLRAMRAIRHGRAMPLVTRMRDQSIEGMVKWFESSLNSFATTMRVNAGDPDNWSVKRALKEIELESPTRWELTVDVTKTPAWREILQQFQKWSGFHRKERTLVFTPEGAVALPSGLPVAWSGPAIQSQKHVMIACEWPDDAEAMVPVNARHVFAKQSCGKVENIFWN